MRKLIIVAAVVIVAAALGLAAGSPAAKPWRDKSLSPDQRAALLLGQMTLDEKLSLVHGTADYGGPESPVPPGSLGGAGYVAGIKRLGIPALQMTDGRSGVANTGHLGRYATPMPNPLLVGASWDPALAYEFGALLGKETRDLGFHVSLGGTANLIREPRNGRNYECLSEDPILLGKMLGRLLKGTQDQGVIGNINRYAVNDQETGRFAGNVIISERAARETDLLAFEIAIKDSDVGTLMCAYNLINGKYTCESQYLLSDVLHKAWNFRGWVMTDWGAAHSTVGSALAGLDQEMPTGRYFGDRLKAAVEKGEVPLARVNDMVRRILRTEFAFGFFDNPPVPRPVNPFVGAEISERIAERGIVLLKNAGQLPLKAAGLASIAVIGSHADAGVLTGSGSNQVDAPGGNAVPEAGKKTIWQPSSPLKAIRAKAPNARVQYDPGTDPEAAARLAGASEIAVVFLNQPAGEGGDRPDMLLPDRQDELVRQVAAANPHTIAVLETCGPVTMPWVNDVSAILEAWYPGIRGGEAIASILFGDVNPSAKLPVTFPKSEADLAHVKIQGPPPERFDIGYPEELKVGYKWFDAENKEPLFPFGLGLSYTTYSYSALSASGGKGVTVSFEVRNTGDVAGIEIAQVYAALPPATGEPPRRLVAWTTVRLAPGESKAVTLPVDPLFLSVFNTQKHGWELVPGEYTLSVGGSSRDRPLTASLQVP
jgi:beta-glucosidase